MATWRGEGYCAPLGWGQQVGCVLQGSFEPLFQTPCVTFRQVPVSLQGPGQSPVLPFACCVSATAACVPAGVVGVLGLC